MAVKNLRDAIILSLLKHRIRSRNEIETNLDIQKTVASKSLSFLKDAGLITKRRIQGNEFYLITDDGRRSIEKIYRKLSIE